MTKVKLCGLMTLADVAVINAARPDFAGFVFAAGRHQVTLAQAQQLRAALAPAIVSVGVFVNAPLEAMLAAVASGAVTMIQLHGHASAVTVAALHRHRIPVIQVVQGAPTAWPVTQVTYLMADAGAGSGRTLPWAQLPPAPKPLFLAGGLTPRNVQQAIQVVHPFAVDVSSGIETAAGKNAELTAAFMAQVRAATHPIEKGPSL
ncbi:phosphoribosylanthranilate isomerase [Lacticaseibacillus daqingensis]|uniref:phosphoribosylanthranilate isomerase n=1 Tax=Lacticaseibacillus daqingensis TaxID=2486014 RepID=UPI000F79E021|nr:phosphoribosylanthranilate isomerase [Lacticaseibacillus daqingensis]